MQTNHFHVFNAIYGEIGRSASEEIILSLLKSKCIPCLLFGLDACPINRTVGNSFDFTVRKALFKILHTTSQAIILDCQNYFNFPDITVSIQQRKCNFLKHLWPLRIVCVNLSVHLRNVNCIA